MVMLQRKKRRPLEVLEPGPQGTRGVEAVKVVHDLIDLEETQMDASNFLRRVRNF